MSDYYISQIYPSDKRANDEVDALLISEGIRRDANLDYTCGMYDDEMHIIATGSCFGNTLRCFAVSHEHLGYRLIGEFRKCGYKFGRWYHMVWMEKMIGEHPEKPEQVKRFSEI